MKKSFLLFISCILILFSKQNKAADYYWVGGTGNYNDSTHWATTSGGSTFQTYPPGITDDVYFDANSFLTSDDTVYFDLYWNYAHNFTVSNVTNNPTFFDGPGIMGLAVNGSFSISAGLNWESVSTLEFGSADPSLSIQTNGVVLGNPINFTGALIYNILDNLHCYDLFFDGGGIINTLNNNVHCTHAFTGNSGEIYAGTSTISSDLMMDFLGPVVLHSDSATFTSPNFNVNTGLSGLHFGTVIAPYISADECFFKEAHTPHITGNGNTIGLLISDTVMVDYGISQLVPNYISKVVAGNAAGFYFKTIVDTLIFTEPGVDFGITDTLTINGEIIMSNTPARPGMIGATMDSCYLNKTSGIVCFDFVSMSNVHAIGGAQFFAGYNSTDNGGNPGWQFSGCTTAGGMWPGDANYDLAVNNLDILAIGLANGETGPTRAGASLSWVEQPVTDWANSFASGINMKHADCDGNGTVEPTDTAAVVLNYGLHHPAARMIFPEIKPNSNSVLIIDVTTDTVGPSSPVHVNVDLSVDSIYGIAFSVYYNSSLINSSSLIADVSSSWLGTPGVDMISFAKADSVLGRIDFALTRIDHTDAFAGTGHLLSFDMVTADNIPAATSLTLEANDVSGIYLSQTYEAITGATDSTFVDSTLGVYNRNTVQNFSGCFNNKMLALNFYSSQSSNLRLSIYDVAGRELFTESVIASSGINKKEIAVGDLAKGVYIVTLSGEEGSKSVKVIKE